MLYKKSTNDCFFIILSFISTLVLNIILFIFLIVLFSVLYYLLKTPIKNLVNIFPPYILNNDILELASLPFSLFIFPFTITFIKKIRCIKSLYIFLIKKFLPPSEHKNTTYSSLEEQEFKKFRYEDYIFILFEIYKIKRENNTFILYSTTKLQYTDIKNLKNFYTYKTNILFNINHKD